MALEKLIQVEMMESIETERLILKALEEKDTESILKIEGDRETAWWSDDYQHHNLDDVIGYVQIKLPVVTGTRLRGLPHLSSVIHQPSHGVELILKESKNINRESSA